LFWVKTENSKIWIIIPDWFFIGAKVLECIHGVLNRHKDFNLRVQVRIALLATQHLNVDHKLWEICFDI
jgi:hypothetical protein